MVLAASPLLPPLPLPLFRDDDDDDDVLSPLPPTLIRLRRLLNLPINFLLPLPPPAPVAAADGVVVVAVGVDNRRSGDDADDFILYNFSADVILVAV